MNSLEMMLGLNPQGVPNSFPTNGIDPMYQMAIQGDTQGLLGQMGVPPQQDPYAVAGMVAPSGLNEGALLTQELLEGQYPEITQDEINALALSLGIDNGSAMTATDPMYAPQFDLTRFMTGGM